MAIDDTFNKQFFNSYLGKKLNFIRINKNLTYEVLGEKIGVSQGYITNMFNGRQIASNERRKTVASALGVSSSEFEDIVLEARIKEFEHSTGKNFQEEKMTPAKKKLLEAIPEDVFINCSGESGWDEHDLSQIVNFIQYTIKKDK